MKTTPQLIKDARRFYKLRNEILTLENKLKPLKEYLLAELDYGETKLGEHIFVKTHHNKVAIASHIRKPYDTLTVK